MPPVCQLIIFTWISANVLVTNRQAIKVASTILSGNHGKCLPGIGGQEILNGIQSILSQITLSESITEGCGPGYWRRVFYLNTSRQDQLCLDDWNIATSPVRACTGVLRKIHAALHSVMTHNNSVAYSKVCGRIIGGGMMSPDAFFRYIQGQTTIEDNYNII